MTLYFTFFFVKYDRLHYCLKTELRIFILCLDQICETFKKNLTINLACLKVDCKMF
jgi:hypothetical protein